MGRYAQKAGRSTLESNDRAIFPAQGLSFKLASNAVVGGYDLERQGWNEVGIRRTLCLWIKQLFSDKPNA
jgi:hypothetical protein